MTEFYEALSADEVNVITGLEDFTTKIKLEDIIWKAIQFGRRVDFKQGQPEDYEDYKTPVCCCCTGYDSKGKQVGTPEPGVLYKCMKPGCSCWTCEAHRQTCGYCLGCCVEDHEEFNHSNREGD